MILNNGYYEEEVLSNLLQYTGSGSVLWDIGANIGLHTITIKHLAPETQVFCFEPSPFIFSRLYLNMCINHVDLLLMNIGLGDSTSYSKLSLMISGNSGLTSFKPWEGVSYKHSIHCYCDTAANLVECGIVPMPTALKNDVEGFEFEVLSGFKDLLKSQTLQAIVLESPPDFIENSDHYPVSQLLGEAGFDIVALPPTNKDEKPVPTNFFARR